MNPSGGRWAVLAALLPWFVPSAVGSMRDGVVYGALGGLGFAIIEFGANFAVDGYANEGWGYLRTAVPGRWALGTESHIIWGATAGVGVGYLLCRRGRGWSVPVGLAIVGLVMATHGLNDLFGKFIGPLAMVLLVEPAQAAGVDLKALAVESPLGAALLVYSAVVSTDKARQVTEDSPGVTETRDRMDQAVWSV